MKYSIVIDVSDINIFLLLCLPLLEKFIVKIGIDKIYVILSPDYICYSSDYSKRTHLNLIWVSRQYYDGFTISKIVNTPVYLLIGSNHILTKPLLADDLIDIKTAKINCSLEKFPHGTLSWTTNRHEWFESISILGIKQTPDIYNYKCMTRSPQVIVTSIAQSLCTMYSNINILIYWFYIVDNNLDKYTESNVLWDQQLCFNAMHKTIPLDYLISNVKQGCRHVSRFITVSLSDVAEAIFDEVSTPVCSQLKTLMDELVLYQQSDYNFIRLGDLKDGGYVICDIPAKVIYGYGVGASYKFEADFVDRYNCEAGILYDHTVDTHITDSRITHKKMGIDHYTHNCFDTIENQLKINGHWDRSDLCLKIDVEGYEWLSLLLASDKCLKHFNQIIIELHWLHSDLNATVAQKISTMQKLNKLFTLVHIHGVNCRDPVIIDNFTMQQVVEATFIRTDLLSVPALVLPHPVLPTSLDYPIDLCLHEIKLSDYYPYNKY